jgi:hypothetical protein
MTLLARVAGLLREQRTPHALIGAAALAAAGIARSTFDLDLLTTDVRVLDDDVWAALRAAGISIEIRRGDADDPLLGVVRIEAPAERPVDVIVGRHAWQATAIARATPDLETIPVVLPRDLVLLKLYAGGTQDLWDVRALLDLPGADRVVSDVEADLDRLPRSAREAWARVRNP